MRELDREFIKAVNQGLVPKVRESAYVMSFVPSKDDIDVQFAVELGVSIILDRPIFAVCEPGDEVSERLRRVADHICVADLTTEAGQDTIRRELEAFIDEHFPEEPDDA